MQSVQCNKNIYFSGKIFGPTSLLLVALLAVTSTVAVHTQLEQLQ